MSTIASTDHLLQPLFEPISLPALNAEAAMLERLDNKYVVEIATLRHAAEGLAQEFDILEIDGLRSFTYETCYFDDVDRRSYFDHHQGRRRRAKVRIRRYVEAGLCFLEVKLKDKRGVTVKKRFAHDLAKFGHLDATAIGHVENAYRDLYGMTFPYTLSRTMDMSYRRMTLVARQGGERMTIDSGLRFFTPAAAHAVDSHLFIVETKSANGNGMADRVFRALHQHPTRHCSKYCMGVALLDGGLKRNRFLPALRKLGGIRPGPAMAA